MANLNLDQIEEDLSLLTCSSYGKLSNPNADYHPFRRYCEPKKYDIVFIYDVDDITMLSLEHLTAMDAFKSPIDLSFISTRWQWAEICVSLVSERNKNSTFKDYENVAICNDEIEIGKAKLAFSMLSVEIDHDNVYSTATMSKKEIFEAIQTKFGKRCRLVVITSDEDTIAVSYKLLIHVWPVVCDGDFEDLFKKQRHHWLKHKKQPTLLSPEDEERDKSTWQFYQKRYATAADEQVELLTNVVKEVRKCSDDKQVLYQAILDKVLAETACDYNKKTEDVCDIFADIAHIFVDH